MTNEQTSETDYQQEITRLQETIRSLRQTIQSLQTKEEEALEKQARYETLFEHADDAIFFETDTEDIVDVNDRACRLFGYTGEELLRLKSHNLFQSDNPAPSIYSDPALGSEVPIETTGIRKDGSSISLEYTVTPLISGRNTVFMFIIRDITLRKKAEKELQKSEEKYRTILDTIQDGYYEIDIYGNLTFCNQSLCRILGYDEKEVSGLNYKEYTSIETGKQIKKFYRKIYMEEGSVTGLEWQLIRKDGGIRFVETSISIRKDEEGNLAGFCGILRDVTDRKKAEEELKLTQEHLKESKKMAALGELVAGVAHEINTPIGIGVTGMSTLAERTETIQRFYEKDDLTQEDFESFLKTVTEASQAVLTNLNRAADLVRTFKQVAVDQTSEEPRKFNVREYINDILVSMQPRLKKTRHTITVNCLEDLTIDSFPGAFSRIISNLIINSLNHGFETIEKGEIIFDISVKQDYFLLKYSDNGKGIDAETLEKIYNPFFTTKRGQGGTGLGMHIVYNLVTQSLNGKIECSSTPGQGAAFLITIPLKR